MAFGHAGVGGVARPCAPGAPARNCCTSVSSCCVTQAFTAASSAIRRSPIFNRVQAQRVGGRALALHFERGAHVDLLVFRWRRISLPTRLTWQRRPSKLVMRLSSASASISLRPTKIERFQAGVAPQFQQGFAQRLKFGALRLRSVLLGASPPFQFALGSGSVRCLRQRSGRARNSLSWVCGTWCGSRVGGGDAVRFYFCSCSRFSRRALRADFTRQARREATACDGHRHGASRRLR